MCTIIRQETWELFLPQLHLPHPPHQGTPQSLQLQSYSKLHQPTHSRLTLPPLSPMPSFSLARIPSNTSRPVCPQHCMSLTFRASMIQSNLSTAELSPYCLYSKLPWLVAFFISNLPIPCGTVAMHLSGFDSSSSSWIDNIPDWAYQHIEFLTSDSG